MANSILEQIDLNSWLWETTAAEELNETPEKRETAMKEFLQLIKELEVKYENFKPRMDESFLMMFLRTRKFDAKRAIDCLERFYQIRLCNPDLILPVGKGPKDYPHVFDRPLVAMMRKRNPYDGSIVVLWSFRNYDSSEGDISDMLNVSIYGVLEALEHPSVQTFGVRYLFDLTGLSMAHAVMMMTKFYYLKAIMKSQNGVPARFKGMHYINDPYSVTQYLYKTIRPALSKKMQQRFHFHGKNLDQLFEFISPDIIPEEIGGNDTAPFNADWYRNALYKDHDRVVEHSRFGFVGKPEDED